MHTHTRTHTHTHTHTRARARAHVCALLQKSFVHYYTLINL